MAINICRYPFKYIQFIRLHCTLQWELIEYSGFL